MAGGRKMKLNARTAFLSVAFLSVNGSISIPHTDWIQWIIELNAKHIETNLHNTLFAAKNGWRERERCDDGFSRRCGVLRGIWAAGLKNETNYLWMGPEEIRHLHTDMLPEEDNFQFLFRICTILTSFHFIIIHFDLQRCFEEVIFRMNFHRGLSQNGFGVGVRLWIPAKTREIGKRKKSFFSSNQ